MFGYIGDLRSATSGRGQFSMEFSHYSPSPNSIVEKVKEKLAEKAARK
jgi:elongation factor G